MGRHRRRGASLTGRIAGTVRSSQLMVRQGAEILSDIAEGLGRLALLFDENERRIDSDARMDKVVPVAVARLHQAVSAHRDEYLRYEIGLEVSRRRLPLHLRDELLGGAPPVLAAPVLETSDCTANWPQTKVVSTLQAALDALGVHAEVTAREPRAETSAACQRWARDEARRRIDACSEPSC